MTSTILGPGDLKQPPVEKGKDPPFVVENLSEMDYSESATMLYYGGSKVGKTVFVATAGPRTLIINIGDGLVTIQGQWAKEKFYKDGDPVVITVRERRNPKTGLFLLADGLDNVKDAIEFGLDNYRDRFDTIAVDDATKLRAFAMNKGLTINRDFNRSQTLEQGQKSGAFVPAVQDYGAEMDLVEEFCQQTIEMAKTEKVNFILTAHERHIFKPLRDATGKKIGEEIDKIRPGFTGKTFPDDIVKDFDLVWRAEVVRTGQGSVYRAFTEDSMSIKAGSRYPGLFEPLVVQPNFLTVLATIKANRPLAKKGR